VSTPTPVSAKAHADESADPNPIVIPAKAAIQFFDAATRQRLDPGLRRDDTKEANAGSVIASSAYSWNFGPDGAFEPWMLAWHVMQPRPIRRSSGCAPLASDCGVCRSFGCCVEL
jgi:hypothetical protein